MSLKIPQFIISGIPQSFLFLFLDKDTYRSLLQMLRKLLLKTNVKLTKLLNDVMPNNNGINYGDAIDTVGEDLE